MSSFAIQQEIQQLENVYKRHYFTKMNIKSHSVNKLCSLLRNHQNLEGYYSQIAEKTGLYRKTVSKWHANIKENPQWHPLLVDKSPRHQVLDDLLEDSIMQYIDDNFLSKGFQFNDRLCSLIALKFYDRFVEAPRTDFKASKSWVKRFKAKYHYVYRKAHEKKRPTKTAEFYQSCEVFIEKIKKVIEKHEKEGTLFLVANVDETQWKLVFRGEMTWAEKGSQQVSVNINYNEKADLTALATITADESRMKLPLFIVKKGTSSQTLRSLSEVSNLCQLSYSDSGWTTAETFTHYLSWLRKEYDARIEQLANEGLTQYQLQEGEKHKPIDLLLDCYSVHLMNEIKDYAAELNINLIFIPPGATDLLQPLDRFIFGALKSMARARWLNRYITCPDSPQTYAEAIVLLCTCWNELNEKTIIKAWALYKDPDEDYEQYFSRCPKQTRKLNPVYNLDEPLEELQIDEKQQFDLYCRNQGIILDTDDDNEEEEQGEQGAQAEAYELYDDIEKIAIQEKEDLAVIIESEKQRAFNKLQAFPDIYQFSQFTNVNNTDGSSCSLVCLLHYLSVIPNFRATIDEACKTNVMESIKHLAELIHLYDNAPEIDACYDYVFPQGTHDFTDDFITVTSSLNIGVYQNDDDRLQIYPVIHVLDTVQGSIQNFQNVTFPSNFVSFDTSNIHSDSIPQYFRFGSNLAVLKIMVLHRECQKNADLNHFFVSIRISDTNSFLMISDSYRKIVDLIEMQNEHIIQAGYYVIPTLDNPVNSKGVPEEIGIELDQTLNSYIEKMARRLEDNSSIQETNLQAVLEKIKTKKRQKKNENKAYHVISLSHPILDSFSSFDGSYLSAKSRKIAYELAKMETAPLEILIPAPKAACGEAFQKLIQTKTVNKDSTRQQEETKETTTQNSFIIPDLDLMKTWQSEEFRSLKNDINFQFYLLNLDEDYLKRYLKDKELQHVLQIIELLENTRYGTFHIITSLCVAYPIKHTPKCKESEDEIPSLIREDNFTELSRLLSTIHSPQNLSLFVDYPFFNTKRCNMCDYAAFYGSRNCFICLNRIFKVPYSPDAAKFAVAGGNPEIIDILFKRNVSFDGCCAIAMFYFRQDVCLWLIKEKKTDDISLKECLRYSNYLLFVVLLTNGWPVTNPEKLIEIESQKYAPNEKVIQILEKYLLSQ